MRRTPPPASLLIIAIAAGLVSLAAAARPRQLTVEDIFARPAAADQPGSMAWSPDGVRLTYIGTDGDLMEVQGASGQQRVLVSREKMRSLNAPSANEPERARRHIPSYIWSPDSVHLLFDSNGQLWYFDSRDGTGLHLASTGAGTGGDPKFSPDGKTLSYIRNHNLYVDRLTVPGAPSNLTDGNGVDILNGEVDWVYQEELAVRSNYFWEPDSKRIAYLQMDETGVPRYPIEEWSRERAFIRLQPYPQPGDANPAVRVGVVAVGGGKTKWIDLPLVNGQDYIPRFGWVRDGLLWIETLSRDHRKLAIYFVDVLQGGEQVMLTESDDKFLDDTYDVTVLPSQILVTGWRDGHKHIYLYSFDASTPLAASATLVRQITLGPWEVASIAAVDRPFQTVYYLSNEGDARQQQIWAIRLDGTHKHRVSAEAGWHDPVFSPNARFFADTYSTAVTPPQAAICRQETQCSDFWKAASPPEGLTAPANVEFKASDGATILYGSLLLPPGETRPHSVPLIVNPYGGPGAASVTDRWNARRLLFDEVLVQHGFAVLHVDNRGMGGRGREFEQAAYHNFGPVQFADQNVAIDQALERYPQLDPGRLGWWGWSWGGSFTLYAMTHSSRFRAGVAVAPVTDWRAYDSIYMERYLGLPAADPDAYHDDSVVNSANHLQGRLLLAHGTSDDNVHFANSIAFIRALIDAGIPYDLQLFPGRSHGIAGTKDSVQLYTRILEHFQNNLMKPAEANPAGQQP